MKQKNPTLRELFKLTNKRLCLLAEQSKRPSIFLLVGIDKNKIEYQVSNGMDCHMYFRNLKQRNREILVVNLEGEIIEIEPEIIDTVNGKQTAYSFIELGWVFTLA